VLDHLVLRNVKTHLVQTRYQEENGVAKVKEVCVALVAKKVKYVENI
tara:strand:+ start:878 stop:1018 length:141 start_codon:yes stop_codon:yes gene_type:complete